MGNGCASFSAIKSSIDLIDRLEDTESVDGSGEVDSAGGGVDDVTLDAVGAVGLAAALIALRTDVRVLRLEGIVNLNEYLKYTKRKRQQTRKKDPKTNQKTLPGTS